MNVVKHRWHNHGVVFLNLSQDGLCSRRRVGNKPRLDMRVSSRSKQTKLVQALCPDLEHLLHLGCVGWWEELSRVQEGSAVLGRAGDVRSWPMPKAYLKLAPKYYPQATENQDHHYSFWIYIISFVCLFPKRCLFTIWFPTFSKEHSCLCSM